MQILHRLYKEPGFPLLQFVLQLKARALTYQHLVHRQAKSQLLELIRLQVRDLILKLRLHVHVRQIDLHRQ